ncbi:heme exporter protein CcmD [Aliiroseovarius subalbicans]|uniref:heme exporter protein CcmD n=1 Tax=Aliiroseovarius subalbicans TaxID=2925840 RepID=UPI001F5688E7|nr:heme exporter protein CcmD [Aliiroseovarius subalbicans]MCI2398870.1 heme exporter protein CcmD [Aliiroseovarius subalbicans]
MLDLGKYAVAVYASWAIALGLVVLLVLITLRQSAKAKLDLDAAEARKAARHG